MRRTFTASLLAFVLVATVAPSAQAQPLGPCTYKLGFKALFDLIPNIVGNCLEDEHGNIDPIAGGLLNLDTLQRTTGGLLVWRQADNWTAFTDGSTTWINGPEGLASRPNAGPLFPWEAAAPPSPPPAPVVIVVPAAPVPAPPSGPDPALLARCYSIVSEMGRAMAGRASGQAIAGALSELEAFCRKAAADYGQAGVICFETAFWPVVRGQYPPQVAENVYRQCVGRL